jgi:hypothetical protein
MLRAVKHRTEPDNVDSKILEIIDFGYDAGDVPKSVIVRILETRGVYLVDRCFFPPLLGRGLERSGRVGEIVVLPSRTRIVHHGCGDIEAMKS